MPFASKVQSRYFFWAASNEPKSGITAKKAREWAHETNYKKLPERAGDKKKRRKKKKG